MSSPRVFKIKESKSDIKKLQKGAGAMISKRLHALLVFKEHESTGISKREVADAIGVNHNSIQTWRSLYIRGGIENLMQHGKIGFKPSVISKEQEEGLKEQLHKSDNGLVGFVELQTWFDNQYDTSINYKTLHGFVVRKFKAKIKVARKSHVKKEEEKVALFKKNLVKPAKTSIPKKEKGIKK